MLWKLRLEPGWDISQLCPCWAWDGVTSPTWVPAQLPLCLREVWELHLVLRQVHGVGGMNYLLHPAVAVKADRQPACVWAPLSFSAPPAPSQLLPPQPAHGDMVLAPCLAGMSPKLCHVLFVQGHSGPHLHLKQRQGLRRRKVLASLSPSCTPHAQPGLAHAEKQPKNAGLKHLEGWVTLPRPLRRSRTPRCVTLWEVR